MCRLVVCMFLLLCGFVLAQSSGDRPWVRYETNVDKTMTVTTFFDSNGGVFGKTIVVLASGRVALEVPGRYAWVDIKNVRGSGSATFSYSTSSGRQLELEVKYEDAVDGQSKARRVKAIRVTKGASTYELSGPAGYLKIGTEEKALFDTPDLQLLFEMLRSVAADSLNRILKQGKEPMGTPLRFGAPPLRGVALRVSCPLEVEGNTCTCIRMGLFLPVYWCADGSYPDYSYCPDCNGAWIIEGGDCIAYCLVDCKLFPIPYIQASPSAGVPRLAPGGDLQGSPKAIGATSCAVARQVLPLSGGARNRP